MNCADVCVGIIILGLVFRLFLAAEPGNEFDVSVNQGWARSAVELGLARSYVEQVNGNMLPNYPPFSLMIFAATGWLEYAFDPAFDNAILFRTVIKIPSILADLGTALLLFLLVTKLWGKRKGLLAMLVYTFHPAVLYDTAVWGQTDAIYTLFIVASLLAYLHNRMMLMGALLAFAFLSKMQTVFIFPLIVILLLIGNRKQFLHVFLGGANVLLLILLPFAFGGTLENALSVFADSVGYYTVVSSAAYNIWWALLGDSAGTMNDTELLFGLLSYRSAGLLLFGSVSLAALILLIKPLQMKAKANASALFLAASLLAYGFFLFNTEMHERYLFPYIALALPVAFLSRKAACIYAGTSFLYFMNLLGWLPMGSVDRALYETFHSLDIMIATAHIILYGAMFSLIFDMRRNVQKSIGQ